MAQEQMNTEIPECVLCEGCDDPYCHRDKLEEVKEMVMATTQQMANQKVMFIEIRKGEAQIKRAARLLLQEMEKIQNMVDKINEDFDSNEAA